MTFGIYIALLILGSSSQTKGDLSSGERLGGEPRIILWAWERSEDLWFIDPRTTGVAFLSRTLTLAGGEINVAPRLQPLRVPEGTWLMAVVRIEVSRRDPPGLSDAQADAAASEIVKAADGRNVKAMQVDFDASVSQRNFYHALLERLRRRLPTDMILSITALASWCMGDPWIKNLPIDEAVPLLFRMGPDWGEAWSIVKHNEAFRVSVCQESAGISTDEPPEIPIPRRRIYIFNPKPWTREQMDLTLKEVGR